jgi:enoyl-CoA hydratase/carnithine racemase
MALPVVKVVWLDNPPVNAVTFAMLDEIERAIGELGESTRALVLRGRGERAFSAGADVTDFASGDPGLAAAIQRTAAAIENAPASASAAGWSWRSRATCASAPRTRSSPSPRSASA